MMETKKMNEKVAISVSPEGLLAQLLETAPDPIVILDKQGKVKLANPLAIKLFDYDKDEFAGTHIEILVDKLSPEMNKRFQSYFFKNLNFKPRGNIVSMDLMKKNGNKFSADVTFAPLRTPEGDFITAFIRDTSERKKLESKLSDALEELKEANFKLLQLSEIDHLTQALNRRGFENVLKRESERASKDGTAMSVAMMDLDNLKMINEKMGHSGGDTVLKEIANRARRILRSTDYLARVGGDEFMILFPSTDVQEAAMVTDRMRSDICSTEILTGITSTISCGVVQLPARLHTLEEMLPLLRNTLERSKSGGKNCVSIGSASEVKNTTKKFTLNELNDILENRLSAVSDPIYTLENKNVSAVEFHVRGPLKLLHTPAELMQVAAEMNMLGQTDLVCAQVCSRSVKALYNHLPIHMNILPSTLETVPVERIFEILDPVLKNRIVCLELSVLRINTEPGYLVEPIKMLKGKGIQIALDDVCYGRSSLEALIVLEPTFVKLDGHFINGLSKDSRRQNAVKRLLKISHVVNAEIIAEGIETAEDLDVLDKIGIKLGQGYFFQNKN